MKTNTGAPGKRCSKCGETKGYHDFPKDRTRGDGYGVYCKPCRYAKTAAWKDRQPPDNPEAEKGPRIVPFRCTQEVFPLMKEVQS
jgi:hypothetical protein